jgi:thiol-disulfide isomerase/thioredoxin
MAYAPTAMSMTRLSTRFLLPGLALSLVVFACGDGSAAGAALGGKPDFRLKTMDGRILGPGDYPGKVVVVDFWATWCQPCEIQSMILDSLASGMGDQPVVFLAADVGETEETVRSFLGSRQQGKSVRPGLTKIPILLDPENKVADALGVQGLPTLMVVDRRGKITAFRTGLTDADTLKRFIHQASL